VGIEPGHPNLEALLAHLDGDGAQITAAHIDRCPACAQECRRLAAIRWQLRGLAPEVLPDGAWQGIAARLQAPRARRRGAIMALAAAASVLVGVGTALWIGSPLPEADGGALVSLEARSHDLEQVLARAEGRARVMDLRTAATVAQLQDQIGVIDETITLVGGRDAQLSARLWGQRVQLMQGLTELQARPVAWREY